MGVKILIEVVEHYADDAPEHWGQELVDEVPKPGDVLQLHWLGDRTKLPEQSRPAHKLEVFKIDNQMGGPTAHGRRVKE